MATPLQINQLTFAALDPRDVNWYKQRKTWEETTSALYPLARQAGYAHFLDVGANHGMVGIIAAKNGFEVLCVEADPRLIPAIERHFADNGVAPVAIVNAIAGARADDATTFSFNPSSTLDNRVDMPNWTKVPVPTIALADLLARHGFDQQPLFVKIDTQGFEAHVLAGLGPFLDRRDDWTIKMEFAPHWLESQGTVSLELLQSLLARFEVAEFPERITWGTPALSALFATPVRAEDAARFLAYVRNLNRDDRGWVDLLVRPRRA